ncbi:RNAse P Rpr2/Rpp21/SNM1 subunit domain-containing protein [Amanita rubescens]|nr:RNAse P Rpr2/Rpp21/SNM1 subunit domain-containing protein [Amanita rubescens]
MAKKDKEPIPNPASIPNKDIIQRLNFLYQASVYLTNLSYDVPPTNVPSGTTSSALRRRHRGACTSKTKTKNLRSKQSRRRLRTADELARAYVDTMTMIGKRATVKMDPSIKRTLCKSCKSVLVPGMSVIVRVKRSSSHKHALVLKCVKCGYAKRVPAPGRKGWDGRGRWDVTAREVDANAENNTSHVAVSNPTSEKEEHKKPAKISGNKRVRDAGHVIFRGDQNVEIDMDEVNEVGDGVFAV